MTKGDCTMIGLITMLKMYQVVKVLTWPLHPWTI